MDSFTLSYAIFVLITVIVIIWACSGGENTDYDTYAKCSCGYIVIAPFGELVHIHTEVCPKCGNSKYKMKVVVGRYVKGIFEIKEVK